MPHQLVAWRRLVFGRLRATRLGGKDRPDTAAVFVALFGWSCLLNEWLLSSTPAHRPQVTPASLPHRMASMQYWT